jgi:hypothetical protein
MPCRGLENISVTCLVIFHCFLLPISKTFTVTDSYLFPYWPAMHYIFNYNIITTMIIITNRYEYIFFLNRFNSAVLLLCPV